MKVRENADLFLLLAAVSLASFFGARGLIFWLGPKVEHQIVLLGGRE